MCFIMIRIGPEYSHFSANFGYIYEENLTSFKLHHYFTHNRFLKSGIRSSLETRK